MTYSGGGAFRPPTSDGPQPGDPFAHGANVAHPQVDTGPARQVGDPFNGPGAIDFNLTDPGQAVQDAGQQSSDLAAGLKAFLFGTDQPDAQGNHGGLPILGWGPIGAAGRFVSEATANTVGAVAAGVGGALERIPVQPTADQMHALGVKSLEEQFNALPDSEAKKAALKQMEADKGLFGTGILSGREHYMAQAIGADMEEKAKSSPDLWAGTFKPAASLADSVGNLFGLLGAGQRVVERGIAGAARSNGMNQLQMIRAVGDGHAVWTADDPGLTPVEQMAYDKTKSGEWTDAQALDFLSSHGAGLAHSKALEIAGSFATDPLTVGALGAGALAKLGETGFALSKTLQAARAGLAEAQAAGDAEKIAQFTKAVETASQGIKTGAAGEGIASRNILGQLAKQEWTGNVARRYGAMYGKLEGTWAGSAAKIARTVIDPMHFIGANPKGEAAISEGATEVTQAVVNAHGELGHIDAIRKLRDLPGGADLADAYNNGLAIYSGNVFRRVAGRQYRAVQMLMSDKGERLIETLPFESLKAATSGLKRSALTQLEEEAQQFVRKVWTEDMDSNLAQRMSVLWQGQTPEEYKTFLEGMSGEQKSLLHAATYGSAVKQLHAAKEAVRLSGEAGTFADRLDQLVLLNRNTLTDLGHEGIMARLAGAQDDVARMAIIEDAKQTYPELRSFTVDPTSASRTVADFKDMMARMRDRLPAQIRDAERGSLPSALGEFDKLITPSANPAESIFTIGFRPRDEFLWGLERDSDGVLREVTDPWLDQVSDNVRAYSPVREVPHNVAGVPIVGAVADKTAKLLDHAEAVGRMAFHGTTGKMVTTAARNKFIENLHADMTRDGTELLTKRQVEGIWKAVIDKANESENISSARGLSERALWDAAKSAIPSYAQRAGLGRRELLVHVLDAYDGDIRTIGLTQKLTGRVKAMLGRTFLGNTAGVISEQAWPLLKFRLNPFFQLQEKIEPWVLNAQRGAQVAFGTKLNDLDRKAMDVYLNFSEKNLINIADNDIGELSARFALGHGLQQAALSENGGAKRFFSSLQGAFDVQGTKQLNMMKTWRKGLGKTMRAEWERTNPGEFDRMLDHTRALMGEAISEDDFAVLHAHSNLAANGVFSHTVDGVPHLNFENAIREGQWSAPQHLGEMQAINLDWMAQRLALQDSTGRELRSSMDIRRALADNRLALNDVSRALREQAAHPDYIARVESAFNFSHDAFWQSVQDAFSLTGAERRNFENLFARIAQNRGMTPVEYLSQVYMPTVARGNEAGVGSLGALVEFSRGGGSVEHVPDLAQLRGIHGQTDIRNLYQQFGQVMAAHLDPSAKRAFLAEIDNDFNTPERITDILDTWDQLGATERLMDRVMNFMQGTPGAGAHTLVADESTGIARVRDMAAEWRNVQGRPRNMQRVTYEDSPELAQRVADDYNAMPIHNHVPTPDQLAIRPNPDEVAQRAALSRIKLEHQRIGATSLPRSVQDSYEAQGAETRRLYSKIIAPRSEGGLGIKVQTRASATPYTDARALRTDLERGRIKVPRDGYWHPFFDAQDAFMQRVVKDVFGHGQEEVGLNSHDAIMSAAAMYSDEARSTWLTDEFAKQAFEESPASRIRQAPDFPQTVQEYEDRYGFAAPRAVQMTGPAGGTQPINTRSVGTGIYAAPPEVQHEIIATMGEIRSQFPDVPLGSMDIGNLQGRGAAAATLVYHNEPSTIVLNEGSGWQADARMRTLSRTQREFRQHTNLSARGVPELASATPRGDIYHEFGHALDGFLHDRAAAAFGGRPQASIYEDDAFTGFMDWFRNSGAAAKVSQYANTENNHQYLTHGEGFSELFDLAFNPDHVGETFDPMVQDAIDGFRQHLEQLGVWHPQGVPAPVNPHAGMTVAEARAAGANVAIPRKVGPLPQETLDELTQHFIGNGRYAESNPDVARIAGYMRDFLGDATDHVLEHGAASQFASFFDHTSGMPVADRVPFNTTEAAFWHGQAQMMAAKWNDAFRLQYFAQNRSVLQRSINHPMFGLYPASYMWGKIGPEIVKFMAAEPFGMRTGAMGYSLLNLQKAVAVQRAYDPEFDAAIEKLGHSAALSWLGYMLPATPWSVPASYPAWMRDMAQQGLANNQRQAAGALVKNDDFITPLNDTLKKVFPMSTQLPFFGRAAGEVNAALPWNAQPAAAPTTYGQSPLANLPAPEPVKTGEAQQPTSPSLANPVSAAALGPTLEDSMRSLQGSLFG